MNVTVHEARRMALSAQGLGSDWPLTHGTDSAVAVVERLGYVQIDTISVVERAHHHIVWSRQRTYRPGQLEEAVTGDARLFEWWSWNNTAAYLPVADYPLYAWHMAARAETSRRRGWLVEHRDLVDEVLVRVRAEGPLGASDFDAPEGFQGAGWWDWKPAKRALDHLFGIGLLLVSGRKGFQRLYDLPERVLSEVGTAPSLSDAEAMAWLVRRLLSAQGVASRFGTWGLRPGLPPLCDVLREMIASGEVVDLTIDGLSSAYYVLGAALEAKGNVAQCSAATPRILSPFDPLIIDRRRLGELFSCDYRLECYLPAAKRRFGYYMLPILWGTEIVGRMDAKALRAEGVLVVRRLALQPGVDAEALAAPFADQLWAYAAFNGCGAVSLGDQPAAEYPAVAEALSVLS